MKTRQVLILVSMAAVVAIAIAVIALRKPRQPSPPPPPAPAPQPHPRATGPTETVVAYLEALSKNDFRAAYGYLSTESRAARPYEEFATLCESRQGPYLDIASAWEQPGDGDSVLVTVPIPDDPGDAGFTTVREDGEWRVVFIEGIPSFPYP